MIGKMLKKVKKAARSLLRGEAELLATEFRLLSRPGAIRMCLSHERLTVSWEMDPIEALELSERLRVSAIRASGDKVVQTLFQKPFGQA